MVGAGACPVLEAEVDHLVDELVLGAVQGGPLAVECLALRLYGLPAFGNC